LEVQILSPRPNSHEPTSGAAAGTQSRASAGCWRFKSSHPD
jgi:hypothetical protein